MASRTAGRTLLFSLMRWVWIGMVLAGCMALWPVAAASGSMIMPMALLAVATLTLFCFARGGRPWPWLYPLLLAVLAGILLPVGYTVMLAFTSGSVAPEQSLEQVRRSMLDETEGSGVHYKVSYALDGEQRLVLQLMPVTEPPSLNAVMPAVAAHPSTAFHTVAFHLPTDAERAWQAALGRNLPPLQLALRPGPGPSALFRADERVLYPFLLERERQLWQLRLTLPGAEGAGRMLGPVGEPQGYVAPRLVSELRPRYTPAPDAGHGPHALRVNASGALLVPDMQRGTFLSLDPAGPRPEAAFYIPATWHNFHALLDSGWPVLRQVVFSLALATAVLALALPAALLNVWCLHYVRRPRLWLAAVLLPAALPMTVALLLLKLPFRMAGLFLLRQLDWYDEAWYGLLLAALVWVTAALLTAGLFFHAAQVSGTFSDFVRTRCRAAAPMLLLVFGSLLLAGTPVLLLTRGLPYPVDDYPGIGLTHTVASLALGFDLDSGRATALLSGLFVVALALGWWRLRLLKATVYQPLSVETRTRPAVPWPRLWLVLMIGLSILPLLFALLASFGHSIQCGAAVASLSTSVSCEYAPSFTLRYWREVLGVPLPNDDGSVDPLPYPWLQWMAASWKIALLSTCFCVCSALSAAWAFRRYTFRASQWLEDSGCVLQFFPLSILALGAALLLNHVRAHFLLLSYLPYVATLLLSSSIALLAFYPLLSALRQRPDHPPGLRSLILRVWRPLAAVTILLLTLQLGEHLLGHFGMLMTDDSITAAARFDGPFFDNWLKLHNFAAAAVLFSLVPASLFMLLVYLGNRDLARHWRPGF